MSNAALKKRLRLACLVILAAGLCGAMLVYRFAADVAGAPLGYVVANGTSYAVSTGDSKTYRREVERYGGKAALMFDDFDRWFAELWRGKTLAWTGAWISFLVSLGIYLFALSLHEDARPRDEDAPERGNAGGRITKTGADAGIGARRDDGESRGSVSRDAAREHRRSRDAEGARGHLNRVVPFVSILLLAYAGVSHAALGGLPEQFDTAGTAVVSSLSSAMPNYTVRDTTLATGTHVREYISAGDIVFAVAWDGPMLPDLKALLGQYFDAMVAESASKPRAGRARIRVSRPEVVIHSGGHMRAFEGSAWIPGQFPAGFTAADVR